jgi:hypothetical protein
MRINEMNVFVSWNRRQPEHDPRNLFALRQDLHALLFDYAKWVVVPMGGQMVVHFIDQSHEAAAHYHNRRFDTAKLSHEFLFARFAWAIIQQAKSVIIPRLRAQFHLVISTSEPPVGEPQVEPAQSSVGTSPKKRPLDVQFNPAQGSVGTSRKKGKVEDTAPLDVNDFKVNEAQELEEDLKLAKRVAPFFCKFVVSPMLPQLIFIFEVEDPDVRNYQYHEMMWYPGVSIMERRKREYMDAHPNIRARSTACPSLSSDDSDSGGED